MSNRHPQPRHRAETVRGNTMGSLSKAVSPRLGSIGRNTAVIAATSGLMLGLAAPGQAAAPVVPTPVSDSSKVSSTSVPASSTYKNASASVTSTPAPRSATSRTGHSHAPSPSGHSHTPSASAATNGSADTTGHTHTAPGTDVQPAAGAVTPRTTGSPEADTTGASETNAQKSLTRSASSEKLGSIASMALKYEGAPYVWGGDSPSGWDCSGFIQYIYGKAGVDLPHNTTAIRKSGKFVPTSNPKPGDLVYQNNGSHAGIYIGGGKIIGAQNPTVDTVIRPADSPYGPLMGYYTLAS
ncbi:C40 family peptidase [Arthrobacter rhombi]|uniref:C40 family peptidase n=1 Tax=Micrococcaceae TaxID=1268 RepID=UPI0013046803|nr:NlpC/P60 family protein [Glutamicibacter sp. BW78]